MEKKGWNKKSGNWDFHDRYLVTYPGCNDLGYDDYICRQLYSDISNNFYSYNIRPSFAGLFNTKRILKKHYSTNDIEGIMEILLSSLPDPQSFFKDFFNSEFGRGILREEIEKMKNESTNYFEEIEIREIDQSAARSEIIDYYRNKDGIVYISDLIHDLKIDPEMIMNIVSDLEEEGVIVGREDE